LADRVGRVGCTAGDGVRGVLFCPHPKPLSRRVGGGVPDNTNRTDRVYNCPPPAGSPRFARGTETRARSVPPASRGNLKELKGVGFFRGHGNLPLKSTKKTYPHTNQHKNHHHQAPLAAVHNHHTYPKPTHNTPTHDQHHTHPTRTTRLRTPKTPTNHAPPYTGGERSPNQSPPTNPPNAHHSPRA
jgi:hypothetical protein